MLSVAHVGVHDKLGIRIKNVIGTKRKDGGKQGMKEGLSEGRREGEEGEKEGRSDRRKGEVTE